MPQIILVRGRPGVGKTAISDRLSKLLSATIIRKDDYYDMVAAYVESHESRNKISYAMLFQFLETNRYVKGQWILDFPFNREEDMIRFRDWLFSRGYALFSVLCVCSDENVWAERFNRRKLNPLPNQLITDFAELKAHYGDLSIAPIENEWIVDTVKPLDSIVDNIVSFVQSK